MADTNQRGGSDDQRSHSAESRNDKRLQDDLGPEERSRMGQKGGEARAGKQAGGSSGQPGGSDEPQSDVGSRGDMNE